MARRKPGAGRKRKDFARNENGEQIPKVWQNAKGYYIINPHKTTNQGREQFTNLDLAIARRDELAGILPTIVEEVPEIEGMEGDTPVIFVGKRKRVNPEYPDQDHAFRETFKGTLIGDAYNRIRDNRTIGRSLQDVLDTYINWYLTDRGIDRNALVEKARIFREIGQPSKPNRKKPKRDWIYFAPRNAKKAVRETQKYFGEFIAFANCSIERLSPDTFVEYKNAIRRQGSARDIDAPNRWISHRFKTVHAVFRRARKEQPSWNWPADLRDWLDLLESRNLEKGEKTILLPDEFEKLLSVADTQWQAILRLALNASLSNTDIAGIHWSNIDFEKGIMAFPRRKTGRMRQTPLNTTTIEALRKWKATAPRINRVFSTSRGNAWVSGGDALGKTFESLRTKAGVRKQITFRSLRKSGPSAVFSAQVNNTELATEMLLGHCPDKTWEFYVDAAPDCLVEAVKAIAKRYRL